MASAEDIEHRKERERQLNLMRAGQFRAADSPSPQRAAWIENDGPASRKGQGGLW